MSTNKANPPPRQRDDSEGKRKRKQAPKPRIVPREEREEQRKVDGPKLNLTRLSDIEEEDVEYVWYPYLARGEVTAFSGDPGSGKSRLIQATTCRLVDGQKLPSRYPHLQARDCTIIFFDCENNARTILKSRFRHLGCANEHRILIEGNPFAVTLDVIDELVKQLGPYEPDVLWFDTANSYFDLWVEMNSTRDAAHAMHPFEQLARRLNCAVGLLFHLTKDTKQKAAYRTPGSIAFLGKARCGIVIGKDAEDDQLARMAVQKINGVRTPPALEFYTRDLDNRDDPGAFEFAWGEFVDMTADEVLNARGTDTDKLEAACDFLINELHERPVEGQVIKNMAKARNISPITLRRAREKLGIVVGKGPSARWQFPRKKRRSKE